MDNFTIYRVADNISHHEPSVAELVTDYFLGTVTSILTVLGICANVCVITLFVKNKTVRSRTSFIITSLAISDCTMAVVGGTMFSINCFFHRWIFFHFGCAFYGVVMFWCGCTSIAHLCAIAVERYITVSNPVWSMANRGKIKPYIIFMVLLCWLYGFIWALLPLLGIQRYAIEGRVSCGLDWFSRTLTDYSFNIVIFITTFSLPGAVLLTFKLRVICLVRQASRGQRLSSKFRSKSTAFRETEWKLTKTTMMTTGFYLAAWTPYTILCIWASFGDAKTIPPLMFTWMPFTAKMSFIFNPFVYVGSNAIYRREMKAMLMSYSKPLQRFTKSFMRRSSKADDGLKQSQRREKERSMSVRTKETSQDFPTTSLPTSPLSPHSSRRITEESSLLPKNEVTSSKSSLSKRSSLAEYAMDQIDSSLPMELFHGEMDTVFKYIKEKVDGITPDRHVRNVSNSSPRSNRNSIIRKHSRTSSTTSNPEKPSVKFSIGEDDVP